MDYPFQIACVYSRPLPSEKNRRRGVCGEGATVHRLVSDGWSISGSSVKTAKNKIPVSNVFKDSESLYGTTVCRCLVRRPHYSARLMRFGSRGPSEFSTEMPWPRLRFTNNDISACCITSVSRARPPENCKYQSPARSHTFAMEKISSPRERRKWSLGLG